MTASFQFDGFPDLFAAHPRYGQRLIEVKLPDMRGSKFTKAQLKEFPLICAGGVGIWILTAATEDEYMKLFRNSNLNYYMYIKI